MVRSEVVLALFARTRDVDLKFEVSIFRWWIRVWSLFPGQLSSCYIYLTVLTVHRRLLFTSNISRTIVLCLVRCWHGFSHVIINFPDIRVAIFETFELIYRPAALLPIISEHPFAEEVLLYIRLLILSSIVVFHQMSSFVAISSWGWGSVFPFCSLRAWEAQWTCPENVR